MRREGTGVLSKGKEGRRTVAWWRTLRSEMVQHGLTPRRNAGLAAYENALARAGLMPVAGIDEAGRGACAGPLVVAAVVLDSRAIKKIPGLADSKMLTPAARERAYELVTRHALDWHVVTIPAAVIDSRGLHVCNIEGMRRAYAGLATRAGYVLTDGFPVRGLGSPALAVWKGDQVAASVAAASIIAKVTRDRMMQELDERYPLYGFSRHKGYVTGEHLRALGESGPCPEHRRSFRCVPGDGDLVGVGTEADEDDADYADDTVPGAEADMAGLAELAGRAGISHPGLEGE